MLRQTSKDTEVVVHIPCKYRHIHEGSRCVGHRGSLRCNLNVLHVVFTCATDTDPSTLTSSRADKVFIHVVKFYNVIFFTKQVTGHNRCGTYCV